jgi:hypothetical protein
MKKMLIALCLVAASTVFAFGAPTYYSFTFQDHSGSYFCDGMNLVWYAYAKGYPKTLVDGNQTGCYSGFNTNGFKAAISPDYQFDSTGAVFILGTATNNPSSLQYLLNPTYETWLNWESGGGAGEFVINYGFWSAAGVDKTPQAVKGTKASGKR